MHLKSQYENMDIEISILGKKWLILGENFFAFELLFVHDFVCNLVKGWDTTTIDRICNI